MRRMRISMANKGNTPWNKGRKHSAETLRRIRERTRLAMQDPKVKMKLVKLGHAQSQETRLKIGDAVRLGWERRRQKLMLQETMHFEWQNLIAEASRKGFLGETELQWNSYAILNEQLKEEWLESVKQRRKGPRPKGSRRAPKSLEQRRKIAEAIATKWTDPAYRDRVCSGMSKYHSTSDAPKRKPREKLTGDSQPNKLNKTKKRDSDLTPGSKSSTQIQRLRLKRKKGPVYKDPLASSKLEMIRGIRAQRAAAENQKTEAILQARLLIAEAEKAAKALEIAAMKSPVARASLIETRKLIAEAVRSIESIGRAQTTSSERSSVDSTKLVNEVSKESGIGDDVPNDADRRQFNGKQTFIVASDDELSFSNFFHDLLNHEERLSSASSSEYGLEGLIKQSDWRMQVGLLEPNGNTGSCRAMVQSEEQKKDSKPITVTKKWIRGRLVEVIDDNGVCS